MLVELVMTFSSEASDSNPMTTNPEDSAPLALTTPKSNKPAPLSVQYRSSAERALQSAQESSLDHVRKKHLASAAAWSQLAASAESASRNAASRA